MPESVFDPAQLNTVDQRLKDVVDDYSKDGMCDCNSDKQKYINKMLVLRTGIDLDLAVGDITNANEKLELITSFLDGGEEFDCGCN